jgi:curved DNA-binding protein
MEYKDYYQILDVPKTAGKDEIKRAYRKLARRYHPDVNPDDPSAEARFREINEANEVLSDPEKRKKYDQLGSNWHQYRKTGGKPEDFDWQQWQSQPGQTYTYRNVTPEEFANLFGGKGGYSDFFESLFGMSDRQKVQGSHNRRDFFASAGRFQGQVQEHPVSVTLEEAFHGTTRILAWEDGRKIEAKIPPGVRSGSRVRLKGQGGAGFNGGPSGDLYLKTEVQPHGRFLRDGDDLKLIIPVDLFRLLLGGHVTVEGIDRSVRLDVPEQTPNGRVFRLRGLGMPNLKKPQQRGDLYITVQSVLPTDLNAEEKDLIRHWKGLR